MKRLGLSGTVCGLAVLAFLSIAFVPATGYGQGRHRDRDWKCGKFVNCHDARDGRRDRDQSRWNRSVFRNDNDNNWRWRVRQNNRQRHYANQYRYQRELNRGATRRYVVRHRY